MISQTKQKGFTIVELLIVIVIIGILAAISIVAYNGVTQKARDDRRVTNARNLVNAAASYNAENGTWPTVAQVQAYPTVKLTGDAADSAKVTATAPTSGTADTYRYVVCSTGGVRVQYWREVAGASAGETVGLNTIDTGNTTTCP
ncbi:prepilin-type N-terminal cleavage/methylation domain-containing protein [Candidatus Saccharibacteria bacterium]|nr:prepilin-type N-terminal cleavage/methylation domain-containing protein [Candidatus Saccharibacteria bacterium]